MAIVRADKAGFCFGVKRAIDMAIKASEGGEAASLGPLIHNQQVVDYLTKQGIKVIDSIDELNQETQLIIRSHGVPPEVYKLAVSKKIKVIDATCPFVQKAQRLAAEASQNSFLVVVGDRSHPEVQGIIGWAGDNSCVIETVEEAKEIRYYDNLAVLAQTTLPKSTFLTIVEELKKHTDKLIIHNTICNATSERQDSAAKVAEKAELMIVVGGRHSSNTRKLESICSNKCRTYLIETADELQQIWFENVQNAGLTAGASTPDWIIEEVYKRMSEIMENEMNENEETMENFEGSLPKLYRGALVKGTVVKITSDEVYVDISWKSEGVITQGELSAAKGTRPEDVVKLGDEISVVVLRLENEDGHPVLSKRRANEIEAKEMLAKAAETKEEIHAVAVEVVKGGLLVDLGMRGFVPASQIQPDFVEDLNKFVGQTLRLRIIEFDESKKKLVLSQKAILAEEREQGKEKLFATLKEGDVVHGTVRRLASFGAFIDLGGVDGLLHVSDMAFSRVNNPAEIVNIGDEVEVQVISIDPAKGRISLGLKQLKVNPWDKVAAKYPVGSTVNAKVVRIAAFGAFVQLEDGIDGLIHISQLADRRVGKVDEVVKVGDVIEAKIIECKPEEKRISLSIRELITDKQKDETQIEMENQPEIKEVTIGESIASADEQ